LKKFVSPELIFFARQTPKIIIILVILNNIVVEKGEKYEFDRI